MTAQNHFGTTWTLTPDVWNRLLHPEEAIESPEALHMISGYGPPPLRIVVFSELIRFPWKSIRVEERKRRNISRVQRASTSALALKSPPSALSVFPRSRRTTFTSMLEYVVFLCATYLFWKVLTLAMRPKSPLDNIDGPPSPSWLTGHLLRLYDKQGWDFHRELQTKYGPVSRLQSLFGRPMLCIYDPVALHSIILKDQHIFEEMGWFLNLGHDSFGPGLLSTTGATHKRQRKLLNPVFSSKNLRRITPVFYEVIHRLERAFRSRIESGAPEIDIAHYMGRTALELAGQATLGHSFDPLTEERHEPYAVALKAFVPTLGSLSRYFQIYRLARHITPPFLRRPIMNILPSRRVKRFLHVIDTLHVNATRIYEEKKRLAVSPGGDYNDIDTKAKDLITILLQANAGASAEDALPEEELIAQLSILLFAATDTSSNAITLVLERLVENPEVQGKLREEVVAMKDRYDGGDIPYDEIMAMPYLDAVFRETLRVQAPAPLRVREARADAVLPLSKPIIGQDGTLIDSVFVPKDTLVFVSIQAANVSQDLWGADAREWRPERWLEPLPESLTEARLPGIYSNLMTFWGGGRSCIGFKFSQLEMKIVIAELLSSFVFEKTNAPVVWNLAEVVHPTLGYDSLRPEYPMKVSLVGR
ncbi:cytochrome P450 [Trametes elegans]|nr:cytochrome P450 [Trametes elegans]